MRRQADDLLRQLLMLKAGKGKDLSALLQVRFYVSDAANQWEELRKHELVGVLESVALVSYIEQPPLCGAKVALMLWFLDAEITSRKVFDVPSGQIAEIQSGDVTYLYQSVRFGEAEKGENAENQTKHAFEAHIAELERRGMNLADNCQRTWIYVRDVDRHYAGVVKARNDIFARCGLTPETHFIASTGIGGASVHRDALVAVDFLSVKGLPEGAVGYLHAPEYLNPTHEYGVAFERGTYIDLPGDGGRCCLVSGTASIDSHGECLHRGDVLTQTGRLFLNIGKLLQSAGSDLADVGCLIVYLRDISDRDAVDQYVRLRFPEVPFLITEARVCRPEWLVEVECVAVRRSS